MRYSGGVIHDQTDLPLAHPSIVWEPLASSDSEALQMLLAQVEEAEALPYRTSIGEVEALLKRSEHWMGVAGYLDSQQVDGSGQVGEQRSRQNPMVAYSYVGLSGGGNNEVLCHGTVVPSHRGDGLGSTLLQWQTQAGARLLETHAPDGAGTLTHVMRSADEDFKGGLSALGYRPEGTAVELRADVADWVFGRGAPSYVRIVSWDDELDNMARRAFNSVNAQLGAEAHASKSQWAQMNRAMNKDWSFIALNEEGDRPRVVGLISTGAFQQDWDALGWKEGVLQIVAVFEPDGHDEILRALLDAGMKALSEAGLDKLSVTLDPISDEGTANFYKEQGFKVSGWFDTYSLLVRNGSKLVSGPAS